MASTTTVERRRTGQARPRATRPQPREPGAPAAPQAPERASRQVAVTVVAPVEPAEAARLRRVLRTMGRDPAGNPFLPLGQLPGTHFARFVLLDAATDLDGEPIEAQLIYMADVDAPLGEQDAGGRHLAEVADAAGDGLDRIFGACAGYPRGRRATRAGRLRFLREHVVQPAAAYVNTVGRTVRQIRQEADLRAAIGRFLDEQGDWSPREPADVRAAIQDLVEITPELAWVRTPAPSPDAVQRVRSAVGALELPAAVAALSPLLSVALPLWAVLLRREEVRDEAPHIRPTPELVRRLSELEDHVVQNQFAAVGYVKPGLVRRVTTEGITRLIDYAARVLFNHADLAGVKTIHFARWVFLDDHRRLIFASSYDGSLESYNDDFIDKVWWGLNAVFSNGHGYPKTSWLLFGGARREQEFKDYLRRHQRPTEVWYSAYPELSAINIDNNAEIRAGLYGDMTRKQTLRWLHRI